MKITKFYSQTCMPCKKVGMILNKLKESYDFELEEICVDDEAGMEKAQACGVTSLPVLIFSKDDNEIGRTCGLVGEVKIKEFLG